MEQQDLDRLIREKEGALSLAFPALMRKVYVWMTLALIITGVTAYGVAHSEVLMQSVYDSRGVFWALLLAELGLVYGISRFIDRLSLTTATLLFILYSALNGATLSVIFLAYSADVITKVFFITAGTFGVMAAFGYFTKTDLTGLGKLLIMALVGLIIASLVNLLLLKSSGFDLILSYIGVLVFVGLTAYDSQKIKRMLAQAEDMGEGAQKTALMGSLTLYLDFINLFLYLLRIFGRER
ncbi:Bax inhibitor-1/YccA family protein [Hoylesella loescheii]|uniref:Bax inhibitor-1/YccA family protein n=1 Tax=Hoylesella loescheii TaxID=840 RepID=UPI0026E9F234|nr:Bax inhibitor-1/YccA family protein [Hoylesella loescheii]